MLDPISALFWVAFAAGLGLMYFIEERRWDYDVKQRILDWKAKVAHATAPLEREIESLKAENAELKAELEALKNNG